MEEQIAFLGLGNMGMGMAFNLASKGNLKNKLIVWNRDSSKVETLLSNDEVKSNCVYYDNIKEAVIKSSIIITCFSNDEVGKKIYKEILSIENLKDKIFVDNATIKPETARFLAKNLRIAQADFISAPVIGAPPFSWAGKLVFVVAGNPDALARFKPLIIGIMGRKIIDLSEKDNEDPKDVGKACIFKIIANTNVMNMIKTVADSLNLADETKLGAENFAEFYDAVFGGTFYPAYAQRMLTGDYYNREKPLFSADNAIKDTTYALELAKESNAKIPFSEAVLESLEAIKKNKGGDKGDVAGLYGIARELSGKPYENSVD